MTTNALTTFVCDRDGTASNAVAGPPMNSPVTPPPDGWAQLQIVVAGEAGQPPQSITTGHLCPNCVALFKDFMGKLQFQTWGAPLGKPPGAN